MSDVEKRLIARSEVAERGYKTACREWVGAKNNYGYGTIRVNGKAIGTHRLAYSIWVAPLIDGLVIDHLCDNHACIEPTHLEQKTIKANVLRGKGITAVKARNTHCPSGHEFTDKNTRIQKDGARVCRECQRLAWHKHKQKYSADFQEPPR